MKNQAAPLEMDPQQLITLAQRESPQDISGEEWKTVQASLMTTIALWEAYQAKDRSFQKLIRLIFGSKSEKAKDLFKYDDTGETAGGEDDQKQSRGMGKNPEEPQPDSAKKKRRKGNGRAGADDYPGLARIFVAHPDMKEGDPCPLCPRGGANRYKESPILRFKAQPPVNGVIKENQQGNPARKGMFTTGVLSIKGHIKIALFFTGRNHAGENLAKVLKKRHPDHAPPVQVSDALSRNVPRGYATIHGCCNDHGRRAFVDAASSFPEQCLYVIEALGQVYKNDETAKNENMDPGQRLRFHCRHSAPVMFELRLWLLEQFEEKKVEPNSALGKAISYMLSHWRQLTLFLWWPGVPLSSCLVEQAIKMLVLGRKNFLFYRTEHGAFIGDLFMSIIHTCNLNGINPFRYITALQEHSCDVFKNPARWMPWNYEECINPLHCSLIAEMGDPRSTQLIETLIVRKRTRFAHDLRAISDFSVQLNQGNLHIHAQANMDEKVLLAIQEGFPLPLLS